MRILAIRGENLASLEGPFAIEFTEAPLDRAGLFAITGPTGAGKSTLLDALCLALFGTAPRLSGAARSYEVGREGDPQRIGNRDPRSLLRRGATRGRAEVDFVGRDGRRYRATWSVWRARNRPDGKLQEAAHELRDLDADRVLASKRTETLEAIRERIGLDYDQFCRSVLLAQGEFAAFLRADEKKRAELLEAVTGTGIYRQLSIAAHLRHAEARRALEALQREHEAVEILGEEERAALEAELAQDGEALARARGEEQAAAEAVRWYETLDRLAGAEERQRRELEGAERACEAAAPEREWLEAIGRVEPIRQLLIELEAAHRRVELAEADRARAVAAAIARADEAAAAQAEAKAAAEREAEAERRRSEAEPLLQKARGLDAALEQARKALAESEARAFRRECERRELEALLVDLEGEAGKTRERIASIEAWWSAHPEIEPIARQWERWRAALARAAELHAAIAKGRARRQLLGAQLREAQARLEQARTDVREMRAGVERAQAELDQAEAARPAEARAGLRRRRLACERQETLARELDRLAGEARRVAEEVAHAERERDEAEREQVRLGREAAEASRILERRAGELAMAERALRDARSVQDLASRRTELEPGRPCPLCGSEHHPWATEEPPAAAMVRDWEERVASLRQEQKAAERRLAALQTEQVAAVKARDAAASRAAAGRERLASFQAKWTERLAAAGRELPPEVAEASGATAAWLEAIAAEREGIASAEAEVDAQERRLEEARRGLDEARLRLDAAFREEQEAGRAAAQAEAECGVAAQQEATRAEELARLRSELAEGLAGIEGWEDAFERDPAVLAARLEEQVERLRSDQAERERARVHLAELQTRLAAERAKAEAVRQAEGDARRQRDDAAAERDRLERERTALLDGEPVDAVAERLQREESEARKRARRACDEASAAARRASEAAGHEAAAEGRLGGAKAELDEAVAAFRRGAEAIGIDEEEARRRLAVPAAELVALRERIDRLESDRREAAIRLEERRRQREEHEATARPALAREEAFAAREAAREASAAAEQRYHEARARLLRDDENRRRSASFLPRLQEATREAERWGRLADLIGSASGDRFQLFAQSLTLDALLAAANTHLRELAPRYALERVAGSHLELQVIDRDMGDEVRSVNSLSGGETFLVSLALALGLSSLSARNAPVESLFIDEGFGSLDPQTLDIALATLDALQAAGRKVGLISHVPGMAERIGVQIRVAPQGGGRSRVEVVAA